MASRSWTKSNPLDFYVKPIYIGVVRIQCPFLLKMALDNFTISIVISNLEHLANVET
jgi:hypothetical protein